MSSIVIVESPAKAKTINKYLGNGYTVLASYGHVRDLPAKDGSVRPDDDFAMSWEVDAKAEKRLKDIAKAVKGAEHLYLATDPDREGEAISWHVEEVLRQRKALKGVDVKRVVFNEVTKQAVLDAFRHPRELDRELVDAYLARRALDYLVGFTLSPVLWRKLPGSRSAGRVQSVALRLVCEREAEIEAFKPREYWTVEVEFATPRASASPRASPISTASGSTNSISRTRRTARAAADTILRTDRLRGRRGRAQADPPQPAAALHDLDLAAGSLAQARLRREPHHAHRAAALRRRRYRRRHRRPHHLHAHRRRDLVERGDRRRAPPHRGRLRRPTTGPTSRASIAPRRRTRRKRTRRSARPTCSAGPTRRRGISRTSSAGSTS